MSVTAAKGFVASGVARGHPPRERKDLAVVRSTVPAVGAAMWTVNQVQAAAGRRLEASTSRSPSRRRS